MTLMTVAAAAAAVVVVQSHDTIPNNDYCYYCSDHGYPQSYRLNPFSVKEYPKDSPKIGSASDFVVLVAIAGVFGYTHQLVSFVVAAL
jgi:hypothetical protein